MLLLITSLLFFGTGLVLDKHRYFYICNIFFAGYIINHMKIHHALYHNDYLFAVTLSQVIPVPLW